MRKSNTATKGIDERTIMSSCTCVCHHHHPGDSSSRNTSSSHCHRHRHRRLYRRGDLSPVNDTTITTSHRQGRHLVATDDIRKGQVIVVERPMVALPSRQTLWTQQLCHFCLAYCGGPKSALYYQTRQRQRQQQRGQGGQNMSISKSDLESIDEQQLQQPFDDTIVPCRDACGHVYCCHDCEQDAWECHHQYLCTGNCPNPNDQQQQQQQHPLVRFKQFAVQTNEILLLVAEWWVAQHVVANKLDKLQKDHDKCIQAVQSEQSSANAKDLDKESGGCTCQCNDLAYQQEQIHDLQQRLDTYTDFTMETWWDVEALVTNKEVSSSSEGKELDTDDDDDDDDDDDLTMTLRQICHDAADLLSQALAIMPGSSSPQDPSSSSSSPSPSLGTVRIPPITAIDVAQRIGACAQNAIGIRQRHPLCRSVLIDDQLRRECHDDIVAAIVQAGFIGNDEDEDDSENDGDEDERQQEELLCQEITNPVEGSDYTFEEIETFLAGLFVDEEGCVRDEQVIDRVPGRQGDDLDDIFPPLDGTAMYAIACKMNHSCEPNVVVLYKRTGWGRKHPLAIFCIALRDIAQDEELTISYIENDLEYAERQKVLMNYGFQCQCTKCQAEAGDNVTKAESQDDLHDVFGSDSDENETNDDLVNDQVAGDAMSSIDNLQRLVERLDSASNHSVFGSVPVSYQAPIISFILQNTKTLSVDLQEEDVISDLLRKCSLGAGEKDYCLCKIVGCDLETVLYRRLQERSGWPTVSYRHAFWCSILTASLGLAHECDFLEALELLDKGMVLGLPRDDRRLEGFIGYVESAAQDMSRCLHRVSTRLAVPNYQDSELLSLLEAKGLSRPIQSPVLQASSRMSYDHFEKSFVHQSKPVVMRRFAKHWRAVSKWRNLNHVAFEHGHRLVPIEVGAMSDSSMKEQLVSLRSYVSSYLISHDQMKRCWSLKDATVGCKEHVAYLAQHPLLNQIPTLSDDLPMSPVFCGPSGPTNVYAWIGTGGTRTPLHFDSYDNLFIQIVGVKYVRLYKTSETPKLYVSSKSSYGLQGNMSEVDCELEDYIRHPDAKAAEFSEVLLFPGDCLFIPARTWHYIRSLSTSISVNYWF